MEPIEEEAYNLIRQAQLLASTSHNSVHRITESTARKALTAARDLFSGSLAAVRQILQTADHHINPGLFVGTLRNAFAQHELLVGLIILTWPEISTSASAKDAVRLFSSAVPAEFCVLDDAIKSYEYEIDRRDAFYARAIVAGSMLERAAVLLKVDPLAAHVASIQRSITFPPEFKQAGIAILSYFSEVLRIKYPDMNVGVTIQQEGDKVTLIVDTPAGERERVEQELRSYGLVVAGDLSPEKFMDRPEAAMALKHKLELAALEVRHTRELLASEREQYGQRIRSLEDQTVILRELLDRDRYTAAEIAAQLRALMAYVTKSAEASLTAIIRLVERGIVPSDIEELKGKLADLEREDTGVFSKLEELIIKGSIQGTAGNYLYAALQALSHMA